MGGGMSPPLEAFSRSHALKRHAWALLATSLIETGVRDHHPVGTVIGVLGLPLSLWTVFTTWRDLRKRDTQM